MSGIMKAFLLLAVVVCFSEAQFGRSGKQCLCQSVVNIRPKQLKTIKDLQIYPETVFCDKVEIVVTLKSGLRVCLNPELKAVKTVLDDIMKPKSTAAPN